MPSIAKYSYFHVLRIMQCSHNHRTWWYQVKCSRSCLLVHGSVLIIQVLVTIPKKWVNGVNWARSNDSTSWYIGYAIYPTRHEIITEYAEVYARYILYSWMLLPHPYGSWLPTTGTSFAPLTFLDSFGRTVKSKLWPTRDWGEEAKF